MHERVGPENSVADTEVRTGGAVEVVGGTVGGVKNKMGDGEAVEAEEDGGGFDIAYMMHSPHLRS
jgi:hypothetical protein